MLRRPPTAITLTQDDITRYEETRQKRLLEQQQTSQISRSSFESSRNSKQSGATSGAGRSKEQRIMGTSGR
jgi:hypothetical protein